MTKKAAVPKPKRKKNSKALTRSDSKNVGLPESEALQRVHQDALADKNLPPGQLHMIDQALKRNKQPGTRLSSRLSFDEEGKMDLAPDFGSRTGHRFRLQDAFGTSSEAFVLEQSGWLAALVRQRGSGRPTETALNAALAAVDGVRPETETEAMLAIQMYATHEAALEMMSRAKQADTVEALQNYSAIATKMLRTYTTQIEAMAKLRRRGEQTVRVEHVHVYPGGQAIVGTLSHPGSGGGRHENSGQPHAPIDPQAPAPAPGSPMLCSDPERESVPVTQGEGETPVSHARWG